jgi:nitroreductase
MIPEIKNHKSIRKYKNMPVPESILNEILLAATRASNTGNMQTYSIIVSKDETKREQLWTAHFKQNMVLQAPVILTFCADINRFSAWCKLNNAVPAYNNFLWFYNASIDAVLASQNAAIQAQNADLGICYLGTTTYMADKIIDILKLPVGVIPVTSIALGYPDENPHLTDRLPLDAIVHHETYREDSDERILAFFSEKEALPAMIKFVAENKKDNLAQVFTDVRYKMEDNLHFSQKFLDIIKKQGFL